MAPGEEGQREGPDSPKHVQSLSARPELPLGSVPTPDLCRCPAPGWPQVHKARLPPWGPSLTHDPHVGQEKGMSVGAQPGKLSGGFLHGGGLFVIPHSGFKTRASDETKAVAERL